MALAVGLTLGAAALFSQNKINLIDQIKQAISGVSPIAVLLTDSVFTISCNNCNADAPSPTAFGNMVGGLMGAVATTQFLPPASGGSATFLNAPISVAGYARNLSVYLTATAANGSVARFGHDPNNALHVNAANRSGVTVFSGQAQASYTDGVGFDRLEVGTYYNVRSVREGATATSVFGGWSAEFVPDGTAAPLIGLRGATVAAATTTYFGMVGNAAVSATQGNVGLPVPFSMTLSRFCVTTASAQPGTGTLVLTVMDSGVATLLAITVPAGAPIGIYCELVNTASLTGATDWTAIQVVNNAPASVSANIQIWGIGQAAATGTKWEVCIPVAVGFGAGTTNYLTLLEGTNTTTEVNATAPFPIAAATATGFYVYVGTAGGVGTSTVLTIRENLAGSAMTATVPAATTGIVTGAGTLNLVQGETLSLEIAQTGAGGAFIGGACFSIVKP